MLPPSSTKFLAAACALLGASMAAAAQSLPVLPAPLEAHVSPGAVELRDGAVIVYPKGDSAARFDAEHLAELAKKTIGIKFAVKEDGDKSHAAILLERGDAGNASPEAYALHITDGRAVVTAPKDAGLYYGTVTLWQLLSAAPQKNGTLRVADVDVRDAPQMRWRGLMLDSARHMQSIEFIHQLIEWMSLEKLNTLHWHLTDDQGWRLEIKRYPKLTQVGAWRELPSEEGELDPRTGKPYPKYGGFYTQAQVRELVAFAAQRGVTIVPEIEMPGHASAAIAAYPEFGVQGAVLPSSPANHYGVFPNLYGVSDATFEFIDNVLTEVMALFPSEYIHVGGDEAIKPQWKNSPEIQAQMKQLGIANEDALQSYFIKRIDTFLTAHGRRTLGWDEILQGGLAPGAAVMSWHGVQGGIDAAKQGHDAVLTPVRPLYFNYRQSDAADEAPGRFAINALADVYRFDPQPATLTAAERAHILGVQANVWTEYLITDDRVAWMLFPRTAALAEVGWSAPQHRDWNDFLSRLPAELARYAKLGVNFDPEAYRVRATETLSAGSKRVQVALADQVNAGTVRFSTDGSAVSPNSRVYTSALDLPLPSTLHAAVFDAAGREVPGSGIDLGLTAESVRRKFSQDLKLCVNDPAIAMEPDPPSRDRPVMLANYRTPCWIERATWMDGVKSVRIRMVALPWVFEDGEHKAPPLTPTQTQFGELEIHADSCTGKVIAALPLPRAQRLNDTAELTALMPAMSGAHDICIKEVRPTLNPLWTLDWIETDLHLPDTAH